MQSYYNTNNAAREQLVLANLQAEAQETEILRIFKAYPKSKFRTFDIEQILRDNFSEMNHDGAKRAITNLTKLNHLIRSKKACVMGPHGKMVNVWWLNTSSHGSE